MRISDLSRQSGVPVGTIKFYLREHLLPPGEPTGRNQALYNKNHLRRLRLIKIFTSIGELDLTSVRRLLIAAEEENLPAIELFEVLNQVSMAGKDTATEEDESLELARADANRIIESSGWEVNPDAAARSHLTLALAAMRRLGCDCDPDFLDVYREAADRLARHEVGRIANDHTARIEALARNVLLHQAFAAMRQLGQQHHLSRRFGLVRANQGTTEDGDRS
ncbi:MerR family transcriptional regulator [Micromonospora sp. NPDC049275]|uniref:MerR family transcriptional regulator n=1 Tax=Micromonospora sp. NPDC049275 TaxID=3364268 RepID=UPI0037201D11